MSNNSDDNISKRYGDFISRVRNDIDQNHQMYTFKRKPLGPLGSFIRLKSQDIAGPLELHLGNDSHAFLCDNLSDMRILVKIFKKTARVCSESYYPTVIARPFTHRHNISSYKAHHGQYLTLLDYLDIEEDPIFNAVVDRNFLESVLFIPEYEEAELLMMNPNQVPRNIIMAYTRDCSQIHPANSKGGYRSFFHDHNQLTLFSESSIKLVNHKEKGIAA